MSNSPINISTLDSRCHIIIIFDEMFVNIRPLDTSIFIFVGRNKVGSAKQRTKGKLSIEFTNKVNYIPIKSSATAEAFTDKNTRCTGSMVHVYGVSGVRENGVWLNVLRKKGENLIRLKANKTIRMED